MSSLDCRPKSEFQRTVFAAEGIHIEQVGFKILTTAQVEFKVFDFDQFSIFILGRFPVRPPQLRKLLKGKWKDWREKMKRYN